MVLASSLFKMKPLIISFITLILFSCCRGQEIEECLITNTSCPCAVRASSGMCMRHQGAGNCIMGECNEGYKCDCLGYEMCSISTCSKFTTYENSIPSDQVPFRCHLTPDAGTCIDFVSFKDTLSATDIGKNEAEASVKSAIDDYSASLQDKIEMITKKTEMDSIVRQINSYPIQISPEERAEVHESALKVLYFQSEVKKEIFALNEAMTTASEAEIKASEQRSIAYSAENEAKEKELELDTKEKKAKENKEECSKCEDLKQKIKDLRKARRQAAIEAGKSAKKARTAKNKGKKHRKNVQKYKKNSKEDREKCIAQARKILSRLRGPQLL